MHLSVLSECFAQPMAPATRVADDSCAHRDSLLRGLVLLAIAGMLIGLTLLGSLGSSVAANRASPVASASIGSAVNHMHREVTGQ